MRQECSQISFGVVVPELSADDRVLLERKVKEGCWACGRHALVISAHELYCPYCHCGCCWSVGAPSKVGLPVAI